MAYIPHTVILTGPDLTGTDGALNRTYTISADGFVEDGLFISVQGTPLTKGTGKDYTVSSGIITFLNNLDNSDDILITYFTSSILWTSSGELLYSTSLGLSEYLHLVRFVPNFDSPEKELLGTGDGSTATYWFANEGVIGDTYTLYHGATEPTATTELTEDTDYTVDLKTSKITLTASGISAVDGVGIYTAYKWNFQKLIDSEIILALTAAENKILRDTEMTFAEFTATNPNYRQVTDEIHKGHYAPAQKVFEFSYSPIVKIQTTVNGAYTTGGTTITLTSTTGLPASGTIYIGGNKVTYTAVSSNDLTIPASTPSIADAATVRGEVIELSLEPEGSVYSFSVLDPETEYEIDYFTGKYKILNNAYQGEFAAEDLLYPLNYQVRTSYMHAWSEESANPTIPDEILEITFALAARRFMGRTVSKKNIAGMNDYKPTYVEVDRKYIEGVIMKYKRLNIGSSPFNKQRLS